MKYIMLYLLHPYKKRYTLATYNDIEYHLHFNVSKVYLAYLLRKDQKYTFRTILSFYNLLILSLTYLYYIYY